MSSRQLELPCSWKISCLGLQALERAHKREQVLAQAPVRVRERRSSVARFLPVLVLQQEEEWRALALGWKCDICASEGLGVSVCVCYYVGVCMYVCGHVMVCAGAFFVYVCESTHTQKQTHKHTHLLFLCDQDVF